MFIICDPLLLSPNVTPWQQWIAGRWVNTQWFKREHLVLELTQGLEVVQFEAGIFWNLSLNKTRSFIIKYFYCRYLSVKKWLLRKKHQIELARKRGWKGYWVCLKGTTLLFYPCDSHSREGRPAEMAPKHLIIVDGAIMQPIPEHPKRDYIFCLSTAFGDAYLFQAPCQVRLIKYLY